MRELSQLARDQRRIRKSEMRQHRPDDPPIPVASDHHRAARLHQRVAQRHIDELWHLLRADPPPAAIGPGKQQTDQDYAPAVLRRVTAGPTPGLDPVERAQHHFREQRRSGQRQEFLRRVAQEQRFVEIHDDRPIGCSNQVEHSSLSRNMAVERREVGLGGCQTHCVARVTNGSTVTLSRAGFRQ